MTQLKLSCIWFVNGRVLLGWEPLTGPLNEHFCMFYRTKAPIFAVIFSTHEHAVS